MSSRLIGLAENLPTMVFLALLRADAEMIVVGWTVAVVAWALLALILAVRHRPDTILLGINLNFALLAPAIHLPFLLGWDTLGRALIDLAGVSVLAFIALTGAVLHLASGDRFLGPAARLSDGQRRRRSLILLGLAAIGTGWSLSRDWTDWMAVGLPILALFIARALLRRVAPAR